MIWWRGLSTINILLQNKLHDIFLSDISEHQEWWTWPCQCSERVFVIRYFYCHPCQHSRYCRSNIDHVHVTQCRLHYHCTLCLPRICKIIFGNFIGSSGACMKYKPYSRGSHLKDLPLKYRLSRDHLSLVGRDPHYPQSCKSHRSMINVRTYHIYAALCTINT